MKTNPNGEIVLLLDSSVLIAMGFDNHTFHNQVVDWFRHVQPRFATCPITQGALVRASMREAMDGDFQSAQDLLSEICASENHVFIPDDIDYSHLRAAGIVGHRQVTDAYLAALARHHGVKLATLDRAQAALNPDVAVLVH